MKQDSTGSPMFRGTPTKAGAYKVTITANLGSYTSAPLVRQVLVTPEYLITPGLYWGIFDESEAFPLGGCISVDLRADGSFTGTLQAGSRRTSFTSRFNPSAIWQSDLIPLSHRFPDEPHVGKVEAAPHGGLDFLVRPKSSLNGDGEYYLAHLDLMRPLLSPGTPPAEALGKHIFAMGGSSGFDEPGGHSFGTLTVKADGSVTVAGQLADGTTVTGSGWYVEANLDPVVDYPRFCFYLMDSTAKSSLRGVTRLPLIPSTMGIGFDGDVWWSKLPVKGRAFPAGFTRIPQGWRTSRYAPLVPGQRLVPGPHTVELSPPTRESSWSPITTPFTLTPKLTATLPASGSEDNPASLTLTITPGTGLFTGRFNVKDQDPENDTRIISRASSFKGTFLPEHGLGLGYFLLPDLPDPSADPPTKLTTSPIGSGTVIIQSSTSP